MTAAQRRFAVSSDLAAPPDVVWRHASSLAGVNAELAPLVRMTVPAGFETIGPDSVVPGQRLFRSWILLFGLLPIDYDDLTLIEVTPGRGFRERSPMLTQREWSHDRAIERIPGGCRVTDEVAFVPRVPFLGALQAPLFRLAFWNRHRRLRRIFGTAVTAPP